VLLNPGDLVQINLECPLQYFRGKTALVLENMGYDATDHAQGFYYKVLLPDDTEQIFVRRELDLLSKTE